ncbi:COG1361 family protein [Thermococcus gorgonarius]|uniref:CARDB domain-containing protein n=1 Tax=Thermococcus gorgonarius TaxID=71997 RepID=A0A2Z2M3Q7_THEGO|nr:hypothetical protein [Thermococcus gorgonarius]ASJ00297.1 hypothetical protein A3K92_01790 [Thermococcus gorgonarius]
MKKPLMALTVFLLVLSVYGTAGYTQGAEEIGSLKLIYSGYVLKGQVLKVGTAAEVITLTVKDVTSTSLILRVVSINVSTDLTLSPGEFKDIPHINLAVSLKSLRADDKVAYIDVYSQNGVLINPPKNPPKVRVYLNTTVPDAVVGQVVPVKVNVENLGPGEIRNVTIEMPSIPGLKLAGTSGSRTIETLSGYSSASPVVFLLTPTRPGEFNVSVRVTYYNESLSKVTTVSEPLTIKAYTSPRLTVSIGGTNSSRINVPQKYVVSKNGSLAYIFITVSAATGDPNFEFAKNVSVELKYPEEITGVEKVYFGTIKAGQSADKAVEIKINGEGIYPIGAVLHYKDPLGNSHDLELGTALIVDSTPPRIVVKKVPVIPTEEQVPEVLENTLENSKNPKKIAESVYAVISPYLETEKTIKSLERTIKYLEASVVVLLLLLLILAYLAVGYYREVKTFRRLLLRKRKYKTGGLPKKWSRDELESLVRELRLEKVKENLPPEEGFRL